MNSGRRRQSKSVKRIQKQWKFNSDAAALTPATAPEETPVVFSGLQVAELVELRERGRKVRESGKKKMNQTGSSVLL